MTNYSNLEKLHELKTKGIISEEEYEEQKKKILAAAVNYNDPSRPWGMEIKTYAMVLHLSQLTSFLIPFAGVVLPIIMWILNKDKDPLIDKTGRIVLNWVISMIIYLVICIPLAFILIGIPLLIGLFICNIVFVILGAIKANEGNVWPYPLSIPFFK